MQGPTPGCTPPAAPTGRTTSAATVTMSMCKPQPAGPLPCHGRRVHVPSPDLSRPRRPDGHAAVSNPGALDGGGLSTLPLPPRLRSVGTVQGAPGASFAAPASARPLPLPPSASDTRHLLVRSSPGGRRTAPAPCPGLLSASHTQAATQLRAARVPCADSSHAQARPCARTFSSLRFS